MKTKLRRRKVPITVSSGASHATTGGSASPHTSARLIRRFHVLLKRRTQLGKARASPETAHALGAVEDEIRGLGGLEAYQRMSAIGQGEDRGGGSERVLLGWLRELSVQDAMPKAKGKLKLLEVGALKPDNYASCSSWIDSHPIDLHSRHPLINEQDFLLMGQEEHADGWDAISLSLVVNFVPEPRDRGRMLKYAHNMLHDDGLLFLALPLPCVSNSRYLTAEHLTQLMQAIGFDNIRERWKDGGKMAYWLFKKLPVPVDAGGLEAKRSRSVNANGLDHGPQLRFDKKVVLREGKRNNFSILL